MRFFKVKQLFVVISIAFLFPFTQTGASELEGVSSPFIECRDITTRSIVVTLYKYSEGVAGMKVYSKEYKIDERLEIEIPSVAGELISTVPDGVEYWRFSYKEEWHIVIRFFTHSSYQTNFYYNDKHYELECKFLGAHSSNPSDPTDEEFALDAKLTRASRKGDLKTVKKLVEKEGAKIQPDRFLGRSALDAAVTEGHYKVTKYLLQYGADPNAPAGINMGNMLFRLIDSSRDDPKIAQLLIDYGVTLGGNRSGWPSLQFAAYKGLVKIVTLLLKQPGTKIESDSWSALALSANEGHVEVVQLLIKSGADVNWQNQHKSSVLSSVVARTPLDSNEAKKQEKIVELLLENGADHGLSSDNGHEAIISAAQIDLNVSNVLQQLIDAGANVNARAVLWNGRIKTPLNQARRLGLTANVKALLEAGATR